MLLKVLQLQPVNDENRNEASKALLIVQNKKGPKENEGTYHHKVGTLYHKNVEVN